MCILEEWKLVVSVPSILLKVQKGLTISIKLTPFFWQISSTRGVRSTITTGVISSNNIRPSGEFSGSIIFVRRIALSSYQFPTTDNGDTTRPTHTGQLGSRLCLFRSCSFKKKNNVLQMTVRKTQLCKRVRVRMSCGLILDLVIKCI